MHLPQLSQSLGGYPLESSVLFSLQLLSPPITPIMDHLIQGHSLGRDAVTLVDMQS